MSCFVGINYWGKNCENHKFLTPKRISEKGWNAIIKEDGRGRPSDLNEKFESVVVQCTRTDFEQKIFDGITLQDMAYDYAHALHRKWNAIGMVGADLVQYKL